MDSIPWVRCASGNVSSLCQDSNLSSQVDPDPCVKVSEFTAIATLLAPSTVLLLDIFLFAPFLLLNFGSVCKSLGGGSGWFGMRAMAITNIWVQRNQSWFCYLPLYNQLYQQSRGGSFVIYCIVDQPPPYHSLLFTRQITARCWPAGGASQMFRQTDCSGT